MTHRPVLLITTLLLAVMALFILWGAAGAGYTLLEPLPQETPQETPAPTCSPSTRLA